MTSFAWLSEAPVDGSVKSADRALRVLLYLAARARPTGARIIARECGLPKSSAYALLNAMRAEDFVAYHAEVRGWGLGEAAHELGTAYLRSHPLERLARPHLAWLAKTARGVAKLAALDGSDVVTIAAEPEPIDIGARLPACLCALGKAMLMHLPEVQLDALYPAWRPVVTEQVVLRRSSLQEELARSRARGYTIDDGVVVSAPVFDESGEVQAAVGLAVRAATGRGELAASVRRAAAAISGDLHNHGKQLRAAG